MKQYLLFHGVENDPSGGWHDFKGTYHTVEEAVNAATVLSFKLPRSYIYWYHIVDLATDTIVKEG